MMRTLNVSILVLTPFTIMFAAGCRDEVAVPLGARPAHPLAP